MSRLLYTLTVFTSAALLFLVQPLVGRLLLPTLGGSASVWTACLLFFQSALLVGYALAHLLSLLGTRAARAVHVGMLAAGLLWLPLAIGGLIEPPVDRHPTWWLLGMLTLSIGIPFVALAANAPTLQRWFQDTGDPSRSNPYFLYSASNLGSLLGLFAYPVVLEPLLSLSVQRQLWSVGYGVMVALVVACALVSRSGEAAAVASHSRPEPLRVKAVVGWVALAFVPSSLSVGVAGYVSTELAPIPLLWVLPLGLYLLTFIQAFAGRTIKPKDRRVRLAALAAFPLSAWHVTQTAPTWVLMLLHLGAFYVIALLSHSRLYDERPHPARLTVFYLVLALGGALGGVFNGLIAPAVFDTSAEYPLVLILAATWIGVSPTLPSRLGDVIMPRVVAGLSLVWVILTTVPNPSVALWVPAGQLARQAFRRPAMRIAAGIVLALLFLRVIVDGIQPGTTVDRSFFAVHRIVEEYKPGYRALIHGSTVHGMQAVPPRKPLEPVTYFAEEGPIGQVFAALGDRLAAAHIGVVGLGAGELASYSRAGQRWTFFEIDPVVEEIARHRFDYLRTAPVQSDVVLGDGRLSLGRRSDKFDLLVLDAFSSDAIPRHLLTQEAMQTYLGVLAEHGAIAFHISNRFVDLGPPLARLSANAGLHALIQHDDLPASVETLRLASTWTIAARRLEDVAPLSSDPRWHVLSSDGRAAWTDEQADILSAIRWQQMAAFHVR